MCSRNSFAMDDSKKIAGCALQQTVVCTTLAGAHEISAAVQLARSVKAAGFPCLVVLPFEAIVSLSTSADGADRQLLSLLPPVVPPLLPRSIWCNGSKAKEYEQRRRQLHRMQLWSMVLNASFDLLGVDIKRRLLRNPLPALAALRTRSDAQYGSGVRPDVIGGAPGWFLKQYYLHTMYIRSTTATRIMVARAAARTRGADDALVFSEELNWGDGMNRSSLPCCHHDCLSKQFASQLGTRIGRPTSATCSFDDNPPLARGPPAEGRNVWAKNGSKNVWRPGRYNTLSIPQHRFGRCTGRDVACTGLHPACPPPPPPFTREVSLAMKAKQREIEKARGERHRIERTKFAAKKDAQRAWRKLQAAKREEKEHGLIA